MLLARALAQEPQFIVLDEPTACLDFGNQGKVMREIRALAASGHGVLFTTHDPNHALRAADRAFLLRDGTQLAEGPVAACSIGRNWKRFIARRSRRWSIGGRRRFCRGKSHPASRAAGSDRSAEPVARIAVRTSARAG